MLCKRLIKELGESPLKIGTKRYDTNTKNNNSTEGMVSDNVDSNCIVIRSITLELGRSTTMSEAGKLSLPTPEQLKEIATKHGLIDWNILQQVTKDLLAALD
jgi:hypothetical protein